MMPVIFIGHGSPMNAIEDNEYTRGWKEIAKDISKPVAILCVSAHWMTDGTKILTNEFPKTIHDFYGFPKELFLVQYKAQGAVDLANKTIKLLGNSVVADNEWGFDHGTWSILNVMYKEADIPVYQMSIDMKANPKEIFKIGSKLKQLRDENVLILGSGNVVHNLGIIDFDVKRGYEFAEEFDSFIKNSIIKRDFNSIINYEKQGEIANLSVPTAEHFNPLLYILGATNKDDEVKIYNNSCVGGSLSMTSYVFG